MIYRITTLFAAVLPGIGSCSADLITNIEFGDAIWNSTVTVFGTRVGADAGSTGPLFTGSSPNGQRVLVEDTFGGAAFGGVHLQIDLVGTISTVGFQDVTLQFDVSTVNNMEFTGATSPSMGSPDGDGILVESTQGVDFDGFDSGGISSGFRTALQTPGTWTSGTATTFSQDLAFDASVNNSSISNLSFQWQINSTGERWLLRDFSLQGNPFVATATTPEPSSILLICLGFAGWAASRRFGRRRHGKNPIEQTQSH